MRKVVTVDGSAGVGKGTLCQNLARALDWAYLDSGAFYRILAFSAAEVLPVEKLLKILENLKICTNLHENGCEIVVNGQILGNEIRTEEVAQLTSKIAAIPEIRAAMTEKFRHFAAPKNLIADGRDMGTVIFPDANLKIYLTASVEIRAERRLLQLKNQGKTANLREIVQEIAQRDERDSRREIAPLKPASDAVIIDTSALSINQVFEQVLKLVQTTI